MAGNAFPDLPELASTTLMMACDPLMIYGVGRKELLRDWGLILSMCNFPGTNNVDWGEVRTLFWKYLPRETLTDGVFRDAMESLFVDLVGSPEGYVAASTVLDCLSD